MISENVAVRRMVDHILLLTPAESSSKFSYYILTKLFHACYYDVSYVARSSVFYLTGTNACNLWDALDLVCLVSVL